MEKFSNLRTDEMMAIDGGCTWCKVGATLITVGGVLVTGVTGVGVAWGIMGIATIWIS